MCLKLLLGLIKMPQYNKLLNVYSNERSFKENERDGKDSDDDERFTFYDKINDIINKKQTLKVDIEKQLLI